MDTPPDMFQAAMAWYGLNARQQGLPAAQGMMALPAPMPHVPKEQNQGNQGN
jgi:hypothetical protein